MKHYNIEEDMRYLQLLSQSFPTVAEASTEIINLLILIDNIFTIRKLKPIDSQLIPMGRDQTVLHLSDQ